MPVGSTDGIFEVASSDGSKESGLSCLVQSSDLDRIYECDDTGPEISITFWNSPPEDLFLPTHIDIVYTPPDVPFGVEIAPHTGGQNVSSMIAVAEDCALGTSATR